MNALETIQSVLEAQEMVAGWGDQRDLNIRGKPVAAGLIHHNDEAGRTAFAVLVATVMVAAAETGDTYHSPSATADRLVKFMLTKREVYGPNALPSLDALLREADDL